jgi:hypothetical protein
MQQQILTVVLADTHRTHMAIVHENECMPYRRRTVQIELTPEQMAAIAPRVVGSDRGQDVHEELVTSWLENKQ